MPTDIKSLVETAGRAVAGAVGTAVGVAAGAADALAQKNAPRKKDVPPKVEAANEELYWREHFAAEPYYDSTFDFDEYLPAWRTGWEGRAKYPGRSFEEAEGDLQADFNWNRGQSRLLWEQAKPAVRAGFERPA